MLLFIVQIVGKFDSADSKNRLLRSVAGGGSDQLTSLRGRWDKFELMMESHELMVKEQVCDRVALTVRGLTIDVRI